jgi:hypothetical protein
VCEKEIVGNIHKQMQIMGIMLSIAAQMVARPKKYLQKLQMLIFMTSLTVAGHSQHGQKPLLRR